MEALGAILAFLLALSLATERIVEILKKAPGLRWLLGDASPILSKESRQWVIRLVALVVGTYLVSQVQGPLAQTLKLGEETVALEPQTIFLFGALASGGSDIWNSALRIVRGVKKETERVKTEVANGSSQATS